MKNLMTALLILAAVGGCARYTTTPASTSSYPSALPSDRSSSDCRGVIDQVAKACIGG